MIFRCDTSSACPGGITSRLRGALFSGTLILIFRLFNRLSYRGKNNYPQGNRFSYQGNYPSTPEDHRFYLKDDASYLGKIYHLKGKNEATQGKKPFYQSNFASCQKNKCSERRLNKGLSWF